MYNWCQLSGLREEKHLQRRQCLHSSLNTPPMPIEQPNLILRENVIALNLFLISRFLSPFIYPTKARSLSSAKKSIKSQMIMVASQCCCWYWHTKTPQSGLSQQQKVTSSQFRKCKCKILQNSYFGKPCPPFASSHLVAALKMTVSLGTFRERSLLMETPVNKLKPNTCDQT